MGLHVGVHVGYRVWGSMWSAMWGAMCGPMLVPCGCVCVWCHVGCHVGLGCHVLGAVLVCVCAHPFMYVDRLEVASKLCLLVFKACSKCSKC